MPADTQCRVRKRSNECESEKRLVRARGQALRLPNTGLAGPWPAVHCRPAPLTAERPFCPHGTISIRSPSFAFMGTRTDYFLSGRSSNGIAHGRHLSFFLIHRRASAYYRPFEPDFLYARSCMRRHLRCRASAHSSNFGTPSRSSYERACWLEVFASVFF